MKNKISLIFALTVIAAFCLNGCGTTISDSLGDPPPGIKQEATVIPLGIRIVKEYEDENKIQLYGGEYSVEPGAIVNISTDDAQKLGEATADVSGSFRVNISNIPDKNVVLIKAKGLNKDWSAPIFYSLRL